MHIFINLEACISQMKKGNLEDRDMESRKQKIQQKHEEVEKL